MRRRIIDGLGGSARTPLLAPDDTLACMAAIPIQLPPGTATFAVQTQLLRDGWEVQLFQYTTGPMLRLSAHIYNHAGEADLLAAKLRTFGASLR
jgi:selenocysteine lyase/cysteine desulfurase